MTGWEQMCTEKDCNIFRGMIIACDSCERLPRVESQIPKMPENVMTSVSVR